MITIYSRFRIFLFLITALVTVPLFGFHPVSVAEVNGQTDVAISGYDAVAYFVSGEAVQGRSIFRQEWQGAYWYFSNASHQKRFAENPEKYAPAYGGYCGYCVSENGAAATGGDPEIFVIHNDRLYLLQSEEILAKCKEDLARYAKEADEVYIRLTSASTEAGSPAQ
jgi:YHS domain-containing protein|tara:strand:- start:2352 stop:2852 length:501 start_codon:yes stop_codon:yes gene_type:complete